jgi:hypothetical protein
MRLATVFSGDGGSLSTQTKGEGFPIAKKKDGGSSGEAARSGCIADAGKFARGARAEINSQTETAMWGLATEIAVNRERSFFGTPRPKRFSRAILQRGMLS